MTTPDSVSVSGHAPAVEVTTGAGKSDTTNRSADATSPADSNAIAVDKQKLHAPVVPGKCSYYPNFEAFIDEDNILNYALSISDQLGSITDAAKLALLCFELYVENRGYTITEAVAKLHRDEQCFFTTYVYRAGLVTYGYL